MKPLAIDLYAGLGGWSDGFLAEGYRVVGFDIERHVYGDQRYPAQLVLQDILTIHGSQFRNADVIVASPPCQNYSYMAMPWKRAKAMAADIRADGSGEKLRNLNALFDACFRIQREACEAAGRHIPMVVENVKGAQPWVGRAKANYGSFYLWGSVESIGGRIVRSGAVQFGVPGVKAYRAGAKVPGLNWNGSDKPGYVARAFNTTAEQRLRDGRKVPGFNFHEDEKTGKPGGSFQSAAVKNGNDWFGSGKDCSLQRRASSGPTARKAASAQIARIPWDLSVHIARIYKPCHE